MIYFIFINTLLYCVKNVMAIRHHIPLFMLLCLYNKQFTVIYVH